jgi:hypothetical protein
VFLGIPHHNLQRFPQTTRFLLNPLDSVSSTHKMRAESG